MRRLPFMSVATLAAGLLVAGAQVADFSLKVTTSPPPVLVDATFTYLISVTNVSGRELGGFALTTTLPASVVLLSLSNNQGSISTNGGIVALELFNLPNGADVQLRLTTRPTAPGTVTTVVGASAFGATGASTNVVTTVFTAAADLGVTLTGPAVPALVNDWLAYSLSVTNSGPNAAPEVQVSTALPAGFELISAAPSNQVSLTNGTLTFAIGNLAGSGSSNLQFIVQPTVEGEATFSASVSSPGLLDTNAANDLATTNLTVGAVLPGQLTVSILSAQQYNPQTGLMEQAIRLSNVDTNDVPSARVIVAGMPHRVFNAVGTNDGLPFVFYGATLAAGQGVDLVLEYFIPTRLPVPDPVLTGVAVPAANLGPGAGDPFLITAVTNLASGDVLIEFEAVPGRSYTILYSADSSFTETLVAQPPVVAPANRVQWLDNGPPKTVSRPADASSRFYRVLLNP